MAVENASRLIHDFASVLQSLGQEIVTDHHELLV
jgi:hypothetical protein